MSCPSLHLAIELRWKLDWISAFPVDLIHEFHSSNLEWNETLSQIAFHSIFTNHMSDARDGHEAAWYDQNQDRCCYNHNSLTLGYGEISIKVVISYILYIARLHQRENEGSSNPLNSVIDLGSGTGNILFASALAYPFQEAFGVELLPSLHRLAMKNLHFWKNRSAAFDGTKFKFMNEDIMRLAQVDGLIQRTNVVLVHATLFDDQLMEAVTKVCLSCRVGTYFVMVSKHLNVDNFEILRVGHERMSWGFANIYLQRRL